MKNQSGGWEEEVIGDDDDWSEIEKQCLEEVRKRKSDMEKELCVCVWLLYT